MTYEMLVQEAYQFREAIERARDAGDFSSPRMRSDRMASFPVDCCDDTVDLFAHYLYHQHGVDSVKLNGRYSNKGLQRECFHVWQEVEGWVVDLTGDQFDNEPSLTVKIGPIYVGETGAFHRQFRDVRSEHTCGIECLASTSWERMYGLYASIERYLT